MHALRDNFEAQNGDNFSPCNTYGLLPKNEF
jgi:hypothetical protein